MEKRNGEELPQRCGNQRLTGILLAKGFQSLP